LPQAIAKILLGGTWNGDWNPLIQRLPATRRALGRYFCEIDWREKEFVVLPRGILVAPELPSRSGKIDGLGCCKPR